MYSPCEHIPPFHQAAAAAAIIRQYHNQQYQHQLGQLELLYHEQLFQQLHPLMTCQSLPGLAIPPPVPLPLPLLPLAQNHNLPDLNLYQNQHPIQRSPLEEPVTNEQSNPVQTCNSSQDSIRPGSSSQQVSKRTRPKKYQCPFCWVSLSNTGQYKGHVRIHTGERPFVCDHPACGKSFTRNEELTRHKRIHTGLRPYACPICNKCFGRKDHLKKHTRTHN